MPGSYLGKGACCGNWFPLDHLSISSIVINEIGILLSICLAVVPDYQCGPCQGLGVVWWASSSNTVSYNTISATDSTLQQHRDNLSLWFHVGSVNLFLNGQKHNFPCIRFVFLDDITALYKQMVVMWFLKKVPVNRGVVVKCCLTLRKSFHLPFNQCAFTSMCRYSYW